MWADSARLQDGTALMSPQAVIDLATHAKEAFPNECVGYIQPQGEYVRLANDAANPQASAWVCASTLRDLFVSGQLRAFCHSHPNGPDCPSETDMVTQLEMAVPFVLIATDGSAVTRPFAWGDELVDEDDLLGLPFRHGVTDCYGLIRRWFKKERDVVLKEVPRNWNWWLDETPGDKQLYVRYFEEAGFHRIDPSAVQIGDCFLAAVRAKTPNHAGVYVGNGLVLHHPSSGSSYDPTRLSKRDPVSRWMPHITHWVRHISA